MLHPSETREEQYTFGTYEPAPAPDLVQYNDFPPSSDFTSQELGDFSTLNDNSHQFLLNFLASQPDPDLTKPSVLARLYPCIVQRVNENSTEEKGYYSVNYRQYSSLVSGFVQGDLLSVKNIIAFQISLLQIILREDEIDSRLFFVLKECYRQEKKLFEPFFSFLKERNRFLNIKSDVRNFLVKSFSFKKEDINNIYRSISFLNQNLIDIFYDACNHRRYHITEGLMQAIKDRDAILLEPFLLGRGSDFLNNRSREKMPFIHAVLLAMEPTALLVLEIYKNSGSRLPLADLLNRRDIYGNTGLDYAYIFGLAEVFFVASQAGAKFSPEFRPEEWNEEKTKNCLLQRAKVVPDRDFWAPQNYLTDDSNNIVTKITAEGKTEFILCHRENPPFKRYIEQPESKISSDLLVFYQSDKPSKTYIQAVMEGRALIDRARTLATESAPSPASAPVVFSAQGSVSTTDGVVVQSELKSKSGSTPQP